MRTVAVHRKAPTELQRGTPPGGEESLGDGRFPTVDPGLIRVAGAQLATVRAEALIARAQHTAAVARFDETCQLLEDEGLGAHNGWVQRGSVRCQSSVGVANAR